MRNKAFNISKNLKYDGNKRCFPSMFYKCLGKKSSCGADTHADKSTIKSETILNRQLTEELGKPITRKV